MGCLFCVGAYYPDFTVEGSMGSINTPFSRLVLPAAQKPGGKALS